MLEVKRNILLNPGPSTTTDTVKLAQVVPDICPREDEFKKVIKETQDGLLKVVHANNEKYASILFCGSGTINMDICLNSLLDKDKKILIANNGSYSQRAAEICNYYNLPYIDLKFPINEPVNIDLVEKTLIENPDISIVYTTHNETGTGILNPISKIGDIAHKYNKIFIVDTTSTYAMIPIDIEKDNIDFCMASAQKGLGAMTGVSFIIGKKDIIEQSKNYPKRSYYCNLYLQYEYHKKTGEMHFTPPVQAIYALKQALKEYFIEGESAKWLRHKSINDEIHSNLNKLGFKEFIKKDWQSGLVISVLYPNDNNWDFKKIHDYCYEKGFTIYPGKTTEKPTFRLCSLGSITPYDINNFFETFKEALVENRVQIPVYYED